MTSPILNEDDTFDRLRRINIKDLQKDFDWLTRCITQDEWAIAKYDEAVRLEKKRLKIANIVTFGLYRQAEDPMMTTDSRKLHKFLCDEAWAHTGWTYESYRVIQYDRAMEQIIEERRRYNRDRWIWLAAFLFGSLVSSVFLTLHPGGWITGVLISISAIGASFGIFGQLVGELRARDPRLPKL